MHCPLAPLLILGCMAALSGATVGWRGDGSGTHPAATPPLTWSEGATPAWRVELPESTASPVLVGGLLLVAADPDLLVALDPASGAERWQDRVGDAQAPEADRQRVQGASRKPHRDVGQTCCTPLSDGHHLAMLWHSGLVASWDLAGTRRWTRLVERVRKGYGQSMGPCLAGDTLVLHIDDRLYGLAWADGGDRWVVDELQHQGSPVALQAGALDLVLTTGGRIRRASDGAVLHEIGFPALLRFNTPVLTAPDTAWFLGEDKFLVKVTVSAAGDGITVAKQQSGVPRGIYYASALIHQDHAFLWNHQHEGDTKTRALEVLDLASHRPVASLDGLLPGEAYPSPVAAGRFIIVADAKGNLAIVEGGTRIIETGPGSSIERPEWRVVARHSLGQRLTASPLADGKRLYLRDWGGISCWEASEADSARAGEDPPRWRDE